MANEMQTNGGGSHDAHQSDYGVDEYALSSEEVEELHACIRENDIAAVSAILYGRRGSDEFTEDDDEVLTSNLYLISDLCGRGVVLTSLSV